MTTTPPPAGDPGPPPGHDPGTDSPTGTRTDTLTDHGPRVTGPEARDLGRLRRLPRGSADRKVAGVSAGLGRHLDIDPVIIRVCFVVLIFFGGAGLLAYLACWLLVPEDGVARPPLGLDDRSRTVALTGVGILALLVVLGDTWGDYSVPWPLLVIAVLAVVLVTRAGSGRGSSSVSPTAPPPPMPPYSYADSAPAAATASYAVRPPLRPPAPLAPRPRNPRRRGPVLFWFTAALAALGIGVLLTLDLAGLSVADSAYPALVVATCAVMLLVGAFYGRAGGLIAVGLVAALVMAAATAADQVDTDGVRVAPTTAAALAPSYDVGAGELVVDLRGITDLAALDGRTLELDVRFGSIDLLVPEGLAIDATATVRGPGHISAFGSEQDGVDLSNGARIDGGTPDAPVLTVDADLRVGEIDLHTVTEEIS